MAELAEGARLLSEYGAKVPSRVRIPLSPPYTIKPEINLGLFIRLCLSTLSAYGGLRGASLPKSCKKIKGIHIFNRFVSFVNKILPSPV